MALRIIVTETDWYAAANVGGPAIVKHKTFDVEAPEVEAFLSAFRESPYGSRFIAGVEVITPTKDTPQ